MVALPGGLLVVGHGDAVVFVDGVEGLGQLVDGDARVLTLQSLFVK